MRQLGVLPLLPGWNARSCKIPPLHFIRLPWQFTCNHLYSWVERGLVMVKCFAQEHNTMTLLGFKPRPLDPQSSLNYREQQEAKCLNFGLKKKWNWILKHAMTQKKLQNLREAGTGSRDSRKKANWYWGEGPTRRNKSPPVDIKYRR